MLNSVKYLFLAVFALALIGCSKSAGENPAAAPEPLSLSLSGPTKVQVPQKPDLPYSAVWVANVKGGVTPLTYDFYFNNGSPIKSSHMNVSYGGAGTDHYDTVRVVVTDAIDDTKDASTLVFIDYPPYRP